VGAQSDQSTALIQLYLSLGGGWDSNVTPEAPARASSTTGGTADGN
jgi:multidrug efflux system outer membrane protein